MLDCARGGAAWKEQGPKGPEHEELAQLNLSGQPHRFCPVNLVVSLIHDLVPRSQRGH